MMDPIKLPSTSAGREISNELRALYCQNDVCDCFAKVHNDHAMMLNWGHVFKFSKLKPMQVKVPLLMSTLMVSCE